MENEMQVNIVVAGGGTAGCAAALAAARRGHRVLLVEEGNCLGGVSTAGMINEFYASREKIGNIFDSLMDGLRKFDATNDRFF